jgi:large subunit ribosomal protein L41
MRASQSLLRKVRFFKLTTKQAGHDYYKGTRTGTVGRHTKHGGYIVNYDRVRTYVVPSGLDTFELTPFVTQKVRPMRGAYGPHPEDQPLHGLYYLNRWKGENGED